MDPTTYKVISSRDVVFFENKPYFQKDQVNANTVNINSVSTFVPLFDSE